MKLRWRPSSSLKALFVLATPAVAVWVGLGDALRVSEKPSEYIASTFSILAASLFAVISIVGDPSMLLPGSWRTAWKSAKEIQVRLMRLTYLFALYLVVLALLVVSEVVESEQVASLYFVHDLLAYFSLFAFLLSIWLPFEIREIQTQRLEQEINARKDKSAVKAGAQEVD